MPATSSPSFGRLTPAQCQEILALSVHTPADVTRCIRRLIDLTSQAQDRIGYFAALYIHVSEAFEQALPTFSHPDYMARLDVVFFRRYLSALQRYLAHNSPSLCWQIAFDATADAKPIVLQHLLLGMNAHINYDLGIATFDAAEGQPLAPLRDDFNQMNALLAGLLNTVMEDLSKVWPWLTIIDRAFGSVDDTMINLSMRAAREHAWLVATSLEDRPDQRALIQDRLQTRVSALSDTIWQPGCLLNLPIALVRAGEEGTVSEIIQTLAKPQQP